MLEKAVRECGRRDKSKHAILLIDSDRAARDDLWSIERLRKEASQCGLEVCVQNPNIEGVFLRLFPGNESLKPDASIVQKQLRNRWLNYRKPEDALSIAKQFSLDDLIRLAKVDLDLSMLLSKIGLFEPAIIEKTKRHGRLHHRSTEEIT